MQSWQGAILKRISTKWLNIVLRDISDLKAVEQIAESHINYEAVSKD